MTGATGVVFKPVAITWNPYSEGTPGTALPALLAMDISRTSQGTKINTGIPPAAGSTAGGNKSTFFPMGSEGPIVKLSGRLHLSASATTWMEVMQGDLLYVDSSEYIELPASGIRYWWVDKPVFSRKKGYWDIWEYELTVTKSWRNGKQVLRTIPEA